MNWGSDCLEWLSMRLPLQDPATLIRTSNEMESVKYLLFSYLFTGCSCGPISVGCCFCSGWSWLTFCASSNIGSLMRWHLEFSERGHIRLSQHSYLTFWSWSVCWFARAVITKYDRLIILEARSLNQGVSRVGSLVSESIISIFAFFLTWYFPYMYVSVQISPFNKDTSLIWFRSTLTASS